MRSAVEDANDVTDRSTVLAAVGWERGAVADTINDDGSRCGEIKAVDTVAGTLGVDSVEPDDTEADTPGEDVTAGADDERVADAGGASKEDVDAEETGAAVDCDCVRG